MPCIPATLKGRPDFSKGMVFHMDVVTCAKGHRRVGPETEVSPKRSSNDRLTVGEANLPLRDARSIELDPPELNRRVKRFEVRVRRGKNETQQAAKNWMAPATLTDAKTGCDDRHAA